MPANDDVPRRLAIVTAPSKRDQKRQEARHLSDNVEVSPETKDLVDRMMLGRWPGSTPPEKP